MLLSLEVMGMDIQERPTSSSPSHLSLLDYNIPSELIIGVSMGANSVCASILDI